MAPRIRDREGPGPAAAGLLGTRHALALGLGNALQRCAACSGSPHNASASGIGTSRNSNYRRNSARLLIDYNLYAAKLTAMFL